MPDNTIPLLILTRQETGNVDKSHNGNIKGVDKSNETSSLEQEMIKEIANLVKLDFEQRSHIVQH